MQTPVTATMAAASPLAAGLAIRTTAAADGTPQATATTGASRLQQQPAWMPPQPSGEPPRSPTARLPHRPSHPQLPPRQRVRLALRADPAEYLGGLGRLAPGARPASLQPLLKRGRCTPSSLLWPTRDTAALVLADFAPDRSGQLAAGDAAVQQCQLSLGTVRSLPPPGVREHGKCWLATARLCLYDGSRFHGNAVKPRKVATAKDGSAYWSFDPAPLLVRCPLHLLQRMQLYIELCVSYELLPEQAARLPAKPAAAARQCDELCLAWALLDLRALATLHTARSLMLVLRGGLLSLRRTLRTCYAAAAAAQADAAAAASGQRSDRYPPLAVGRKRLFGGVEEPALTLKLAPVASADAPVAALLPAAAVVCPALARVVGLYRLLLAEAMFAAAEEGGGQVVACSAPLADHVLSTLPAILDDPDLSHIFFQLWQQHTGPRVRPGTSELKGVLRQCVTLVWAMMGSQALPPPAMANNSAWQWERRRRMEAYTALHPVVGLGSATHEWLHRPFDAAELVVSQGALAAAASV